jgi:hypothetical protein
MSNSKVAVTEGSGKNVATYAISEDATTKDLQRITLNDSAGSEITTLPVSIAGTVTVGSHAVTNAGTFAAQAAITAASGSISSGAIASGAVASGAFASGALASGSVASGALASGSVADGAMVTIGAKADAKSTATDTTAITLMQVAKQISASAQLISTALGATALDLGSGTGGTRTIRTSVDSSQLGTLGSTTMAGSVPVTIATDQTNAFSAAVTLTRTADTNVYAANDVLGAATGSTAALTFASMGPSSGRVCITSCSLEIDASAVISGETSYRLYLYNITPPSALGDNAAWDLPSGDRASFLGYVDLGTPVDLGSTLYVQTDNINKQIKLAGTSIFAYLVTVGTYTPTSARVHIITLHTVGV